LHMDSTVVAVVGAAIVQFAAILIWGSGLTHRVKTLEAEMPPLQSLTVKVAVLVSQLEQLNASIGWMRQAPHWGPDMPPWGGNGR